MMPAADSPLSVRLYRMLLRWLYPPSFRSLYAPQLEQVFRDRLGEVRSQRGSVGLVTLWCQTLGDLVVSGLRLRAATIRTGGPTWQRPPNKGDRFMNLVQDIRYATRTLRKAPAFAAIAVATLGLGIGANTAVFSVIHGVLLEPLPYPAPDRLVRVFESSEAFPSFPIAPANFLDYRERNDVFDGLALYMRTDLQLAGGERPERLTGMRVSAGFFRVLGYPPALGRAFRQEEEISGNDQMVVLSDRIWRARFGGGRDIIGNTITLSGLPYTVVGVMPPGLQHVGGTFRSVPHGEAVDIWFPFVLGPDPMSRGAHYTNVVGRLREGVTVERANAAMNVIASGLAEEYPNTNEGWQIRLVPLREEIVGRARPMLLVLLGAVGLVLLIACVNVANIMLSRGTTRQREISIRLALGASRSRLVRQMLTESLVLAVVGGVAGTALATWGVRALVMLSPTQLPRLYAIGFDPTVFAFALGATAFTGTLFGLAPALQAPRVDITESLRAGGRGTVGDARGLRLRGLLVVVEVSLAFVLLVGAGLLLRSFVELRRIDPGFRPSHVLTASISLPSVRYAGGPERIAFFDRLVDGLRELPSVTSVGVTSDLPWTGYDENTGFEIEGWNPPADAVLTARYHFVDSSYFESLGIPLLSGRFFSRRDDAEAPRVILINQSMARRYWEERKGGGDPVGGRLDLWGGTRTVVGVVGDVKDAPDAAEAKPALYLPVSQWPIRTVFLTIATATDDPLTMAGSLRREVARLDAELPIADVRTMGNIAAAATSDEQFTVLLVGIFAVLALSLAAAGVYGVVSYGVSQRTHEIGVRMALGASHGSLLGTVVRKGMVPIGLGVSMGLLGAVAATRALSSLLFGVTVADPATYVGVSMFLTAVGLAACYIPARRAAQVDPMVSLRSE